MKRFFFIAGIFLPSLTLFAQEPADALRYSWTTQSGTARQQAIGGAMGSLGGDISATFVNPAGLGFYKTGDFVFTPGYNLQSNKSTYFGSTEKDKKNQFVWGTTGFVMGWGNGGRNGKTRSSSFSLAINRNADFNSNILYRGSQNQSSFSQKFLEEIQNNNEHDANNVAGNYPYGTSLAFNTYWIDTIGGGTSGNYQFQTRAPIATGLLQQNTIQSKGGITELAIAGAANVNDKFYYGGTLGIPILRYERTTEFLEADSTNNPNNNFDFAAFSDNLKTSGVGVNLKAGIIFKPVEDIRLGLAFHSPTYYSLSDKYSASVTTDTEGYQGLLTQSTNDITGGASDFRYSLLTPYRVILSASYVLREIEDVTQQRGFLTADLEYINYKASSFHADPSSNNDQSTKDYLKQLNTAIDNAYKGAINVRVGGELKFTTVMVRAGAAYYGNPYKNIHGEKGSRVQVTGGLGYRNKGFFIDLAYVVNITKDVNFPYRLQYAPYQAANVKGMGGNAVLTVGFKI
ncbi:MAG TPA: aromatic hydrocarbon degradation protein [Chitinophagaceae bacterium]|nr:aromatic hydrocarbon degradation protein [Chitinophagaceae bacterium]